MLSIKSCRHFVSRLLYILMLANCGVGMAAENFFNFLAPHESAANNEKIVSLTPPLAMEYKPAKPPQHLRAHENRVDLPATPMPLVAENSPETISPTREANTLGAAAPELAPTPANAAVTPHETSPAETLAQAQARRRRWFLSHENEIMPEYFQALRLAKKRFGPHENFIDLGGVRFLLAHEPAAILPEDYQRQSSARLSQRTKNQLVLHESVALLRFKAPAAQTQHAMSTLINRDYWLPAAKHLLSSDSAIGRLNGVYILRRATLGRADTFNAAANNNSATAQALPLLFQALADSESKIRFHAAIVLQKLTGTNGGYNYNAQPAARDAAIRRWRDEISGV